MDVDPESQVETKVSGPKGRPVTRLDSIKQAILSSSSMPNSPSIPTTALPSRFSPPNPHHGVVSMPKTVDGF